MPPRKKTPSSGAALALLTAFCASLYGMTLAAPVVYDDVAVVRLNPIFVLPWRVFLGALFSRGYFGFAVERTYQPLITLFHYAAHASPAAYRAAGIALHAVNGWLVFRLARRLKLSGRAGLAAAVLFCAFPPSTETVNISAFKGHLLACAFGLAALDFWLSYLDDGAARALAAAAGLYALALLSKETGLVFGVLAALAWACLSRKRKRLAGVGAMAAASAAYLAFRFLWLNQPPPLPAIFDYPAAPSLAWYLRSLVWPWPLCLEHTLTGGIQAAAALAAWFFAVWLVRDRPARLWLVLWIPAALLPFLHFVPFANNSPVADRYLYVPAAGFCLLLADALADGPGAYALAALGVGWFASTAARNGLYRSERALYEQTAACAPDNVKAQWLLGTSCLRDGDAAGAEVSFKKALTLSDDAELHGLLGQALAAQGKTDAARKEFERAKNAVAPISR